MDNSITLQAILDRLSTGQRLSTQELQILVEAVRSQQVTIATGDRAVAVGGSADGAVIVTGDRNIVITGADAEAIRDVLGKRPRSEKALLQAVKDEVNARLHQSLHNAVLIQLGMEAQPEQVKRPWDSQIKIGNKAAKPIPASTSILEIFDQTEIAGKLLILGDPGAGKTTTMLDLSRELCQRAEHRPDFPIPILVNLSSWTDNQQSIRSWLVAALKLNYGVRKNLAEKWIDDHSLLPILDGLDELESGRQELCVQQINLWLRSESRPLYLVVCSRREEYEIYPEKLLVNGAICLQPLTYFQLETYLADIKRIDLWRAIHIHSTLRDLVGRPLFLSIAVLAEQELSLETWQRQSSNADGIQYLLESYVRRMFTRQVKSLAYGKQETPSIKKMKRWLISLAQQLQQGSQTEFLIEEIQPTMLPTGNLWKYKMLLELISGPFFGAIAGIAGIVASISCLFFGAIAGIVTSIPFALNAAVLVRLVVGIGLAAGIISSIIFGIFFSSILINSKWLSRMAFAILCLSFVGFSLAPFLSYFGLIVGLLIVLVLMVSFKFFIHKFVLIDEILEPIQTVEAVKISWAYFLVPGLTVASITGLVWGLVGGLASGLGLGLTLGLAAGITVGLGRGIEKRSVDLKIVSNQGIKRSFQLFISCGIIGMIGFGLLGMISVFAGGVKFETELFLNLLLILYSGLFAGLFYGMLFAGKPVIQHLALRIVLYQIKAIPWNYTRFLDHCTDRLLLQRVGGRYRFIHRLLQEHFAAMPLERVRGDR